VLRPDHHTIASRTMTPRADNEPTTGAIDNNGEGRGAQFSAGQAISTVPPLTLVTKDSYGHLGVVKCFGPTDRHGFWPRWFPVWWFRGLAGVFAAAGGLGGAEPVGLDGGNG
jgi:hypothetical protein